MVKVTILDGYVDEPTCLGVPPYISPYPRYTAGAVWSFDKSAEINYVTIDQIRTGEKSPILLNNSDLTITIAGVSVPGRYLSGFPASPNELLSILKNVSRPLKILCGPAARHGFGVSGGKKTKDVSYVEDIFDLIIQGDTEIVISELLENKLNIEKTDTTRCRENAHDIREYAIKGSQLVLQHPFYPDYLITEIETYRGCPRGITGGCSFCSEPQKGPPDFRPIDDIVDETRALYDAGVRHFRLGNQPCIFSYMAENAECEEFPRPNPEALEKLFQGIRNVAPSLKTLHIDNANPGIIARYPDESRRIAKTIVRHHTPGDVAAFGVESVDPVVLKKNNLKATPEEVYSAIKLLNQIGSKKGSNGMPELLPGLNFVFGLEGETKNTYQLNYEFLKKILDEELLLRRINLRQVIPIPGTKMYSIGNKIINKNKQHFKRFKKKIRENIEQPLLKKTLPVGIVVKNVYAEKYDGKLTLGRQIGSYPLLIGMPGVLSLQVFYDVKVVDYGYRSITGVPYPLDINHAKRETIQAIPGLGGKRTNRILSNRPFKNSEEFIKTLDEPEIAEKTLSFVVFK
jgi:radical SAM superfamily enzyme with C-terminal helix-hairpin-helix motif